MIIVKKKSKVVFYCTNCGYESLKWLGKCPDCNAWNSFAEEEKITTKMPLPREAAAPEKIGEITIKKEMRVSSGFPEVDRVLGGGFIAGELILLSGEPGIGKSTLVLQIAKNLGEEYKVLYCSGEESKEQIKYRGNRLGITNQEILISAENNFENITKIVEKENPEFLIIDSIQTMYTSDVDSAPGTISQAREISGKLLKLAKNSGMTVMIVGHITKDGGIAGPKLLEHMVDVVLYFEGEKYYQYRSLRSYKNRFGSSSEIGIFEMVNEGLKEVPNPSKFLLQERAENAPGSVITAIFEGSRAILLEIQALVSESHYNQGRRVTTGYDYNRINMIIAVLEKKLGVHLSGSDIYVNIVGGIKIAEPAVDLAIAMAIVSSYRNKSIDQDMIVLGEIGLSGEVRSVSNLEKRIKEGEKMGFAKALVPFNNKSTHNEGNIKLHKVKNIGDGILFINS
ncbi:MAG: DNA repair protein RadA [Eubacteriales bacterium]|nr:DNA repair protein RadA [Eubacteriales bacterium]